MMIGMFGAKANVFEPLVVISTNGEKRYVFAKVFTQASTKYFPAQQILSFIV